MERNCAFTEELRKFRYRAAGIIIEDGCVLMVTNDSADYYYSIGGAVHMGETAEEAVLREVFEEAKVVCEIDRLLFINENFFFENGIENHEISFYYLIKPVDRSLIYKSSNSCGFDEYLCWIPISDLPDITAFPSFFKTELINLPENPVYIITDSRFTNKS